MTAPTVEVKDYLVAQGVGTFGATSGWAIYIGIEPEDPDTVITLYDRPGDIANPKYSLDYPRWQIRVRGTPNSYVATHGKAKEIKDVLLGLPPQNLGTTRYDGVFMVGDIFYLQADEKGRPIFITNWRGILEPVASGNRISL